jgi:hypothetical protein
VCVWGGGGGRHQNTSMPAGRSNSIFIACFFDAFSLFLAAVSFFIRAVCRGRPDDAIADDAIADDLASDVWSDGLFNLFVSSRAAAEPRGAPDDGVDDDDDDDGGALASAPLFEVVLRFVIASCLLLRF